MHAFVAIVVGLLLEQPGDRLFARGPSLLREQPREQAPVVRPLHLGDELVEAEVPEEDFKVVRLPSGWRTVQTIDVPSGRAFSGFVKDDVLTDLPPSPAQRIAALHVAIDQDLAALEAQAATFTELRTQVNTLRAKLGKQASAGAQLQAAQAALADDMERKITPRALDVEDALSELRDLDDSQRGAFANRFGRLSQVFRP